MDESSIPIDINIGKLQDWLVSRRHVSKEWQESVLAVREKINNAIQDMPAHEGIASLLSGSYINYFHCTKIVEILKETEADTKNMFGRYGSQRMKDWQDLLKCYEKDNLYLAEAAQMLVRNINYEIPSLKKQIAKQQQTQTECETKATNYVKNEASTKAEFLASCKQLGIKGDNMKRELVQLLTELPDIYNKIAENLRPNVPAMQLHAAFKQYMTGAKGDSLPMLEYVLQRGNTTVYEWTYGEPPLSVEPETAHHADQVWLNKQYAMNAASPNEIDFGSLDASDIDFGDGGQGDIDFGDGEGGDIDFGDNSGGEIDWGGLGDAEQSDVGQDIASVIADISLEESGIVVEDGGVSGGVARGREALTVLDNPPTRMQFIEQIVELESFLKMRLYETSSQDSYSFSLVQDLPTETTASLSAMLDVVQVTLAQITDQKLTHLHNIKHSARYVDLLAGQLEQKLSLCEKLSRLVARERERGREASAHEAQLRPLLARIVERSTELQAEIEKDISKKYKGRPVNIIGGVKFL